MACPAHVVGDDAGRVRGAASSEARDFETVYAQYRNRVLAFAARRLGNYYEAEDVTQEVFLEAYRCIGSYEGRSSLLGWILGIANNHVRRSFRRRNPVLLSLDSPKVLAVADPRAPVDLQVEANQLLERSAQLVNREFSPDQREVFQLRYGENQSIPAIARRLGKSSQAVKTSLHRSRRTLARRAGHALHPPKARRNRASPGAGTR